MLTLPMASPSELFEDRVVWIVSVVGVVDERTEREMKTRMHSAD
jgi:hypothetical protein